MPLDATSSARQDPSGPLHVPAFAIRAVEMRIGRRLVGKPKRCQFPRQHFSRAPVDDGPHQDCLGQGTGIRERRGRFVFARKVVLISVNS